MKLKSFGCSFIYGSDLSDCPYGTNVSQLSYPALLARQQGLVYECHARPSSGNLQIYETLLSNIELDQDHVYVVQWTWIDRFSYIDESLATPDHWNHRGWCSILPSDQGNVARVYYQYLHSQFRDKLATLTLIKSAVDCLKQHNQKFIMTYSDDLIFENEWHTSPAVIWLQDAVRPHVWNFEGSSFCTWAQDHGFAVSEKSHPLDPCHVAAAEILNPVIDAILHRA